MTIRPAIPADVESVLPMVSAICALHQSWDPAKYNFKPNPADMYRRWLTTRSTDPRSVFLVAEREEKIVAFLIATIEQEIPIYQLKEYAFIHDLWVDPAYRNEGIARQMTMLAIEKFRDMNIEQIRLDTAAQNAPARSLFTTCGFRPSTTEMLLELQ